MLTTNTLHQNDRKSSMLLRSLPRIPSYAKSTVPGFVDLNLDRLDMKEGVYTIALPHYYKHPSGDMIPDPDMTMMVDTEAQTVEALTYQDIYRYDELYPDGEVNQTMRRSLNNFLALWFQNCIDQGHRFTD